MYKTWFNHNYKYLSLCVDVFGKNADVMPLKERDQQTVTDAFNKIFAHIGVPKTIYSHQGSEFNNPTFQTLLDKHHIPIMFGLTHAPFIEVFIKYNV